MRKRYYVLIACNGLFLSGTAWALYWYNKPHRNVAGQNPSFRINATDLYGEYRHDEAAANQKFTDKVLEIKGTIAGEQIADSTANIQISTSDPDAFVSCNFGLTESVK